MTIDIQKLQWEIERVRDTFHQAVFSNTPDLDAALALTAPDCVLVNLPAGTGATGTDELRRYLAEDVLPHVPADLTFRRVSRTVDKFRVVDEVMVGFTHDRALPWLLPGTPPTNRHAELLAISVVTVRRSLILSHRTLWDHAGLVAQLALHRGL